jgi:hypothetical protein
MASAGITYTSGVFGDIDVTGDLEVLGRLFAESGLYGSTAAGGTLAVAATSHTSAGTVAITGGLSVTGAIFGSTAAGGTLAVAATSHTTAGTVAVTGGLSVTGTIFGSTAAGGTLAIAATSHTSAGTVAITGGLSVTGAVAFSDLVGAAIVTGSAHQKMQVTGLDSDADGGYTAIALCTSGSANIATCWISANDEGAAQYYYGVATGGFFRFYVRNSSAGALSICRCDILSPTNYPTLTESTNVESSDGTVVSLVASPVAGYWSATTKVTTIEVTGDRADAFGVGSGLYIFKRRDLVK